MIPVLLLADPGWSHGIVGIVASKLVETHHKPVLVAQILGESTKGSARSVGSFNMVEALRANEPLLTKFGGHFFAAGYTLPTANLEALRRGLCDYYVSSGAAVDGPAGIVADLELTGLAEVSWPTFDALALLEPHGAGNPAPYVGLSQVSLDRPSLVGQKRTHLRTGLTDESGRRLGGIGFGLGERFSNTPNGAKVKAIGTLDVNEYMGNRSLQLIIAELIHEQT